MSSERKNSKIKTNMSGEQFWDSLVGRTYILTTLENIFIFATFAEYVQCTVKIEKRNFARIRSTI